MRTPLVVFSLGLLASAFAVIAACATLPQDQPAPYDASPLGNGLRLAQVQNPKSPDYHPGANAIMSSLVVTWLDTFDETMDGKSVGTLYVQDIGSTAVYSGIGIYEPSYVPASLTVLPGDVLDVTGPYQESTSIGSAMFPAGTYLAQLGKPVGTYRYDFTPPPPAVITPEDLSENGATSDSNFAHARQWMGMLVTIENVQIAAGSDVSKRVTYPVGSVDGGISTKAGPVNISNELYNLGANDFPAGTKFKSITGIVTWFYSFQIAPRTAADLVPMTE